MIKVRNDNDPYGDVLGRYFLQEFPSSVETTSRDVLEIVSGILLGTKEYRYGPLPSPESQVVIRKVIKNSLEKKTSIPVLVPWGSIKGDGSSMIDVAEVSAINRLVKLSREVSMYHPNGLDVIIRVEDLTGKLMFEMDGDRKTTSDRMDEYSLSMKTLVRMLGNDGVRVKLESEMENAPLFEKDFRPNVKLVEDYLVASRDVIRHSPHEASRLPQYGKLAAAGWKGIISQEQRDYYTETYARLYGDDDPSRLYHRLALYLACALSRKRLGMTGVQGYWDSNIQAVFLPPVKGVPEGYNDHYVYYRTVPVSCARTHICPWRARGYFIIDGQGVTTPKLAPFSNREVLDGLHPAMVTLDDGVSTVNVRTDYLLL